MNEQFECLNTSNKAKAKPKTSKKQNKEQSKEKLNSNLNNDIDEIASTNFDSNDAENVDPRVLAIEYALVNPNGSNEYTELQAVSNINMEDIIHRVDPSFFDFDSFRLKKDDEGVSFYFYLS